MTPVVCSIGSTDPWNAAGLGLDVRALADCGAYGVTVVAGVTAQDRAGLHAASAVAPELIAAQLAALRDAEIAAYRVGALLDAATVDIVAAHLRDVAVPVVYDPVFGPSHGGTFVDEPLRAALRARLLPTVDVVTPNLGEAAALAELAVSSPAEMAAAGRALRGMGCGAALVKGGHLHDTAVDVLVDADGATVFEDSRLPGTLRGTGCLLAAALAAGLAGGVPLREAVAVARDFVRGKLNGARTRGGMSLAY